MLLVKNTFPFWCLFLSGASLSEINERQLAIFKYKTMYLYCLPSRSNRLLSLVPFVINSTPCEHLVALCGQRFTLKVTPCEHLYIHFVLGPFIPTRHFHCETRYKLIQAEHLDLNWRIFSLTRHYSPCKTLYEFMSTSHYSIHSQKLCLSFSIFT